MFWKIYLYIQSLGFLLILRFSLVNITSIRLLTTAYNVYKVLCFYIINLKIDTFKVNQTSLENFK